MRTSELPTERCLHVGVRAETLDNVLPTVSGLCRVLAGPARARESSSCKSESERRSLEVRTPRGRIDEVQKKRPKVSGVYLGRSQACPDPKHAASPSGPKLPPKPPFLCFRR